MAMKDQSEDIEEFYSLIRLIIRDFHVFGRRFLSRKGLTPPQYHVLSFLSDQKEAKMHSLKDHLAVTGSVATVIVDKLIAKKLVERGRWGKDRREVCVSATSKGKALVKDLELKKKEIFGALLDSLEPKSKRDLLKILKGLSLSLVAQKRTLKTGKL